MHHQKQVSLVGGSKFWSLYQNKSHCNDITNNRAEFFFPSQKQIMSSVPIIKSNFIRSTGPIFVKSQVCLKFGVCPSLNNFLIYHLYLNQESSSWSITKVPCSVTSLLPSLNTSDVICGFRNNILLYIFLSSRKLQVHYQI